MISFGSSLLIGAIIVLLIYGFIYYIRMKRENIWFAAHEKKYNESFYKSKIPVNHLKVNNLLNRNLLSCMKNTPYMLRGVQYIWIEVDSICFFPEITTIKSNIGITEMKELSFEKISIKISDINYVDEYNTVNVKKEITGGGGGGSSIPKALVGYALAGSTGAIIASRKKTDPISYKTTIEKDQYTILNFKFLHSQSSILFDVKSLIVFNKLLPGKSQSNYLYSESKKNDLHKNWRN